MATQTYDIVVDPNTCNICLQKMGAGEGTCPGHYQLMHHIWNQEPGFKIHQQFRVNQDRKRKGLLPLEFSFKAPKQFTQLAA